jgi:hypothetical protein
MLNRSTKGQESMDARYFWRAGLLTALLLLTAGANHETANFTVNAPCVESAQQFAEAAEQYRKDLAMLWLGETLPDWSAKCYIKIHAGNNLGAGGKTSFIFENGEVFGWEMEIQGPYARILDSVLPHEITHMILASHFRMPIPRWLDEGMATSVEHSSEKENYRRLLRYFLKSDVQRCFPLNRMVAMKDYPDDAMPFYAQGFSLVEYLLEYGREFDDHEHRRLVRFVGSAMQDGNWQSALQEHYGIQNLGELQTSWIKWVAGDSQSFQMIAEIPSIAPPNLQTAIAQTSARPLPLPIGMSVYDRQMETTVQMIPVKWSDESPVLLPASFGRNVIMR